MTTDKKDLRALAEGCKDHQPLRYMRSHGALYIRNDSGIVFDVHQNRSFPELMSQNKNYADFALACTPATVLALLAEIDHAWREAGNECRDWAREVERRQEVQRERDQLKAENEALRKQVADNERKLDALLAHCDDGECPTCAQIICPHGGAMHFHHDGCPSCAEHDSAMGKDGQ